jgi:hypothetical protein
MAKANTITCCIYVTVWWVALPFGRAQFGSREDAAIKLEDADEKRQASAKVESSPQVTVLSETRFKTKEDQPLLSFDLQNQKHGACAKNIECVQSLPLNIRHGTCNCNALPCAQTFCSEPCWKIVDRFMYFPYAKSHKTGSKNRTLRIVGPIHDGFWVRVLMVIEQLKWATGHGLNTGRPNVPVSTLKLSVLVLFHPRSNKLLTYVLSFSVLESNPHSTFSIITTQHKTATSRSNTTLAGMVTFFRF